MADVHVDCELIRRFEAGLDPRHPERSTIPGRILGQGRISTVFAIDANDAGALAYKRLAMFRSVEEAERYEALYRRYVRALGERVGIRVMPGTVLHVPCSIQGRVAVYIVQEQAHEDCVGHMAIYRLAPADIDCLLLAVLQEIGKVFNFNLAHQGDLELGFDGRISNWVLLGFDPEQPRLPQPVRLAYLDTTAPMMRRRGQEQFDTALFFSNAPLLLLPIFRRYALPDLMSRYYDFRRVALDLVTNFHREGRSDLVPRLVDAANWFFLAERQEAGFRPLTVTEVDAFYRRELFLGRAYYTLRRLGRTRKRSRYRGSDHVSW